MDAAGCRRTAASTRSTGMSRRSATRAPDMFYGDFDEDGNRFVLVLEDLGHMRGIPQSVGVDSERALLAIREIAGLQARFWEAADEPALSDLFMRARLDADSQ